MSVAISMHMEDAPVLELIQVYQANPEHGDPYYVTKLTLSDRSGEELDIVLFTPEPIERYPIKKETR